MLARHSTHPHDAYCLMAPLLVRWLGMPGCEPNNADVRPTDIAAARKRPDLVAMLGAMNGVEPRIGLKQLRKLESAENDACVALSSALGPVGAPGDGAAGEEAVCHAETDEAEGDASFAGSALYDPVERLHAHVDLQQSHGDVPQSLVSPIRHSTAAASTDRGSCGYCSEHGRHAPRSKRPGLTHGGEGDGGDGDEDTHASIFALPPARFGDTSTPMASHASQSAPRTPQRTTWQTPKRTSQLSQLSLSTATPHPLSEWTYFDSPSHSTPPGLSPFMSRIAAKRTHALTLSDGSPPPPSKRPAPTLDPLHLVGDIGWVTPATQSPRTPRVGVRIVKEELFRKFVVAKITDVPDDSGVFLSSQEHDMSAEAKPDAGGTGTQTLLSSLNIPQRLLESPLRAPPLWSRPLTPTEFASPLSMMRVSTVYIYCHG